MTYSVKEGEEFKINDKKYVMRDGKIIELGENPIVSGYKQPI